MASPSPAPGRSFWQRAAHAYGLTAARDYGWAIWTLTMGRAVATIGRGVAVPFLAVYLTEARGIALGIVGVAVLMEQVLRAFSSPLAGWVSDRVGRKPVMVTGLGATALAIPAYLLVTDVPSLFAVSACVGLAQSMLQPASSAYVSDVTRPERRAGAFGLLHVATNLGWAVGIALGAGIAVVTPSFVPVFAIGGLAPAGFALIIAFFIREPERSAAASKGNPFRDIGSLLVRPVFATFVVLSTAFFLLFGTFNIVLPLFITDGLELSRAAISLPFAVNPVLIVLLQLPLGALGDRVDRVRVLAGAGVLVAAGYAVFAWVPAFTGAGVHYLVPLVTGAVFLTVGEILFIPVLSALAAELAPVHLRGSAMGVFALAGAVGFGGAPIVTDAIVAHYGWPWVWGAFAAWTILSATGFLAFRSRFHAARAR